jgi:hypothetical protein
MNLPRKASLGLLAAACAGLLLLPWLCNRSPEVQVAAQGPKKIDGNPDDPRVQLGQLREHIQQLKMDLDKRQHEMQKRAEELDKAMHQLRQLEAVVERGALVGGNPFPGAPGQGGGNIEQRLKQVEMKLDAVLEELRELRKGMKQGPKGSGPGAGNPFGNPLPNPRPKGDPAAPPPIPPKPPFPPQP